MTIQSLILLLMILLSLVMLSKSYMKWRQTLEKEYLWLSLYQIPFILAPLLLLMLEIKYR